MHLTPACPVANIFVLNSNIDGRGRERRGAGRSGQTEDPAGWQRWGDRSKGGSWRPLVSEGQQSGAKEEEEEGDRNKQEERGLEAKRYR